MVYKEIERIKQLLIRYLAYEASPEEEKELQEWQDSHPAYRHVLGNLQDKSFFSKIIETEEDELLYRREWQRLSRQTVAVQNLRKWRRVAAVAALLIPVFMGLFFFYVQRPKQSPVAPDNNQTLIYWADGKVTPVVAREKMSGLLQVDTIRLHPGQIGKSPKAFHQIVIPRGAEYRVCLDDGTLIHLNAESQLEIPVDYNVSKRSVKLKGGAYFEVAPDSLSPFTVYVRDMKIEVLGTGFDVRAYEDEEKVLTTLVHGKVGIHTVNRNVILHPGMQAAISGEGGITVSEVNVLRYTAWLKGRFIFENERLEDILKEVSRWYDVRFYMGDSVLADIRMTMNLPRYQDWESFVRSIERIERIKFLSQENGVYVSR